ncbi:MAG: ABC transporter permease [Anaerolineae bacterium]|jgi:oligopeptide transport system permease protein|nr:ABC transporter permease [Anaerolineae bacterium]MDH7474757.1 ABC transporter permease [Anaerolineae bacterium]
MSAAEKAAMREKARIAFEGTRRERTPWGDAMRQLLKNRAAVAGGIFVIFVVLVAILADVIAPYHFAEVHFADSYAAPGAKYLAGADYLGRDILSRTIYGSRVSLAVAFVASTVSLVIGIVVGMVSGYAGGRVDNLLMRLVDFLYGFPFLIFVILLQVYFKALSRRGSNLFIVGPLIELNNRMGGLLFIFIAMGFLDWLQMARIARGQVLSYKQKEFVEAARMVGAGDARIIFRHLLPNVLGPCIVSETLAIPGYIFTEAFLSFIGLGVDAPTPSWGIMISEGYTGLRSYPYLIMAPAVALVLTVLAFNFLGDGLRDAFDPRLRGE